LGARFTLRFVNSAVAGYRTVRRRPRTWVRLFVTGLVLWLVSVLVTYVTGNPNLIPTLVLLGSFLVPATFVAWAYGRRDTGEITVELLIKAFVVGGVLGVCAASLLETYLLHPSAWLFLGVGLIEEAVKVAALAWFTRHLRVKSMRDGMILGATVGFGFAAFESAGYAMTAMFTAQGLSLTDLVTTELLRGVLAPVGHGLWTAILGGVLFSQSNREHFILGWRFLLAFLGVSVLHALWDSMHSIALVFTLVLTGQLDRLRGGWTREPTPEQVQLFTALNWVGLAIVALIGLAWLYVLVRHSREQRPVARVRGYRVSTDARWWPGQHAYIS
jgi:RsiW-degrading membrane proteinase PrsW (M82 family)